jgi:ADP-ribosylglycohydrolase
MSPISLRDRIEGAMLGLLVGDAVGVPYEFHEPMALPHKDALDMTPPDGFARAHRGVPPGTYSDDGAQALCLLASLLERDGLDVDDFGARLVAWYHEGAYAVDGRVFDVGIASGAAIRAIDGGVPAARAGGTDERSNGNGSLMRVLPLALFHRGDDSSLVDLAHRQSAVTHGHPRSEVCCAHYCLWARGVLAGRDDAFEAATRALRTLYAEDDPRRGELEFHVRPDEDAKVSGSGYVVDSLRSARWALAQGSYEDVIRAAISLGRDTDTTACIAGGIAGLRDGVSAIPSRWRAGLRGQEIYAPLISRLLTRFDG